MKCILSLACFAFLIGSISGALVSRIVGGENTVITAHPYQASLRVGGRHFCGATIIGEKHVLTAAHCLVDNPNDGVDPPFTDVTVNTGMTSSGEPGNSFRLARVTVHPKSTTRASFSTHDIAVITLDRPIRFDGSQQKAEIPESEVVSGTKGYLTGWGRTSPASNSRTPVTLQRIEATLLNNEDCLAHMPVKMIQETEICALQSGFGHGAHMGDSGGPVVVGTHIVGILSWVPGANYASGLPEILTSVYAHRKFIKSTMKKYP